MQATVRMMQRDELTLSSGRATATISAQGGRLSSLVVDDMELLITEGAKATRCGSFPMVPCCGRLAGGDLSWGDDAWKFDLNSPSHANHGLVFDSEWPVVDDETLEIDLPESWPFGGSSVVQSFVVDDNSFCVTMELHAGTQPMPGLVGWHPWFRRQMDRGAAVNIDFVAELMYG